MFPLFSKTPPQSADELRDQLNASLGRAVELRAPAVEIIAPEFPRIERLAISLDHAVLSPNPAQPNFKARTRGREIPVGELSIAGRDVGIRGATANLNLAASEVRLIEATNTDGEIVLLFDGAQSGHVEASAEKAAIESLIATFAKQAASAQGVTIERVTLDLRQRGARNIAAEVRVRARKFMLGASIRITGDLDVDDALNARLSNLRCHGEGALGSVACGFLSPHLARADGLEFPLSALPFAHLQVRDMQIKVGDQVSFSAQFAGAGT